MRSILRFSFAAILLTGIAPVQIATPHQTEQMESKEAIPAIKPGLKLENLLRSQLAGAEGIEVIVSRVTIPPNTSLPRHWHPGEEFAYVLEGTVTLWQKGKEDIEGEFQYLQDVLSRP